jgi:hypothetical protein
MLHELIVIAELESASGLTRAEIVELVEYGVFEPAAGPPGEPAGAGPDEWRFPDALIGMARHAARLRSDFDLTPAGLAIVFAYRERVRELECRLPLPR